MLQAPDDLSERHLALDVAKAWGIGPIDLVYAPVGFGSHHWVATAGRRRWFVSVDDLGAKRTGEGDTLDDAFLRLERALVSASVLSGAGLDFVVAPLPTRAGTVLRRLSDRYSVALHDFVDGENAGDGGREFRRDEDRDEVVRLVARLHGATPLVEEVAVLDDLTVPLRLDLEDAIDRAGERWSGGPYADRAQALVARNVDGVLRLLTAMDLLAARVNGEPERFVITHGEPGAHNVLVTETGHRLVDWDTARLAAPERDLWSLDPGDGSALVLYEACAGVELREEALDAYRLWYDLCEIAGYVQLFRQPHVADANAAESWMNLQHFLQPTDRWPHLT